MELLREYVRLLVEGKKKTWYHGRRGPATFSGDRPSFFTDKESAEWFAFERGSGQPTIYAVDVQYKKAASLADLEDATMEAQVAPEDISKHSSYEGDDNFNDYLYVPAVRQALERAGFDAYIGWDQLENDEVKILVVWHPEQIRVVGQETREDY